MKLKERIKAALTPRNMFAWICVVLGVGGFFGWRALRSYRERKHTLHFKAKRKLKFK